MRDLNALQVNIDFIFLLIFCSLLLFLPPNNRTAHTWASVELLLFCPQPKNNELSSSFFPSAGPAMFVLSATFLTIQPK